MDDFDLPPYSEFENICCFCIPNSKPRAKSKALFPILIDKVSQFYIIYHGFFVIFYSYFKVIKSSYNTVMFKYLLVFFKATVKFQNLH